MHNAHSSNHNNADSWGNLCTCFRTCGSLSDLTRSCERMARPFSAHQSLLYSSFMMSLLTSWSIQTIVFTLIFYFLCCEWPKHFCRLQVETKYLDLYLWRLIMYLQKIITNKFEKNIIFCRHLESHWRKEQGLDPELDPEVKCTDPRIRIHSKMSRIGNTGYCIKTPIPENK